MRHVGFLLLALLPLTSVAEAVTRLFWGDTHVHTAWSGDAFALGTRLSHDEAYRFAKGHAVRGSGGRVAQLAAPLDFLVIADHAENLGVAPLVAARDKSVPDTPAKRRWYDVYAKLPPVAEVVDAPDAATFQKGNAALGAAKGAWQDDYDLPRSLRTSIWKQVVNRAEAHNAPGRFTTFAGYEWTGRDQGRMIHRNVVFRDGAERVLRTLPFSRLESDDPEALWKHLHRYETETGGRVISIPHNANLSGGRMFAPARMNGTPLTEAYVRMRAHFEPIVEVTQIKGDGETHPALSPDDAWADFENWPVYPPPAEKGEPGSDAWLRQSFARSALQLGLAEFARFGVNPFRFGMIGSTDTHTALATADEAMFWGKMGLNEPGPWRALSQSVFTASGYAAVWAADNTREALFDAMRRGETYASTGPRIRVRFFGGWTFTENDLTDELVAAGYARGVPMGGDLAAAEPGPGSRPSGHARPGQARPGAAPGFLIRAGKDPAGVDLDRIQVVKGWLDASGQLHERLYDVALATGRAGEGPGDRVLAAHWADPDFDPALPAFYYVRVLEVPKPRWTAWDARRFGIELPADVPATVQDRAYTSPIWFSP